MRLDTVSLRGLFNQQIHGSKRSLRSLSFGDSSRAMRGSVCISSSTVVLLGCVESRQRARLIYLSSDEVLGESFVPLAEGALRRPSQPYAASKSAAEVVLSCYRDTYSLDVVIVRSCNLVGAHQRARKLIPHRCHASGDGREGSHFWAWNMPAGVAGGRGPAATRSFSSYRLVSRQAYTTAGRVCG